MIVEALAKATTFLVIGCKNYGAETDNPYSTKAELKFAYEHGLRIIVVRLTDDQDWPPIPSPDIDGCGAAQNKFILGNKGLNMLF